jgi:pilus assembly protein CpaB
MRTNRRSLIFFGLALVFGLGAAFTARDFLRGGTPGAEAAVIETQPVVIARVDLSTGAQLREQQFEVVDWPASYVPAGAFDSAAKLNDRVPRRAIRAGEPVLESTLLAPGSEAGLVAVIKPNVRAVSVKVDPVIGVAGFVRPGARVDVLATLRRIDRNPKLPYSKAILQDVKVLAIDQQMETADNGDPELVSVVTLEVATKQAEHLIYAAHEGKLQLALRGPGDHEIIKTRAVGVADLLASPRKKGTPVAYTRVQVLKGAKVNVKKF